MVTAAVCDCHDFCMIRMASQGRISCQTVHCLLNDRAKVPNPESCGMNTVLADPANSECLTARANEDVPPMLKHMILTNSLAQTSLAHAVAQSVERGKLGNSEVQRVWCDTVAFALHRTRGLTHGAFKIFQEFCGHIICVRGRR